MRCQLCWSSRVDHVRRFSSGKEKKKTCKNSEERKRFSITSQLLMSLGVKHASSCRGFRCSLYLPPPFSLNFAPVPSPLCHLPVTVLSLCCPSVSSPRSYALLIFTRGVQMSSLPQSKRCVFIYFTSSPWNFTDGKKEKYQVLDGKCPDLLF